MEEDTIGHGTAGWSVGGLRYDNRVAPLGVTNIASTLSWRCHSNRNGARQTAYRVQAASRAEFLTTGAADLWDSGIVASAESIHVPYDGSTPRSGERVHWMVTVWDESGQAASSGKGAWWEAGLLDPAEWSAQWIGAGTRTIPGWAPLLRREFESDGPVLRARLFVVGLGYAEVSLNGERVGDRLLDPAQTDYDERVFVTTHDVTQLVTPGTNALGVMLGDGFYSQSRVWAEWMSYGPPVLLLQLVLDFADGRRRVVVSDSAWKQKPGPVTLNNVFAGEVYDARLEDPGWDSAGFDDSLWASAQEVEGPDGQRVDHAMEPIRAVSALSPVSISRPGSGIQIVDFGRNLAGWVRLAVDGPAGCAVTLRFAEELDESGLLQPDSGGPEHTHVLQEDRYICNGHGAASWEPRFTYHGFRFVEVSGLPGDISDASLTAIEIRTDLEQSGEFECSDANLNSLRALARNTFAANIHGIPTDCPVREKAGWTGDAMIISDSLMYEWNSDLFFRKYVEDMATSRAVNGTWTQIVPGRRTCGEASPAWASAQVEIPWRLYQHYGDRRLLQRWYGAMCDWTRHLKQRSQNWIVSEGLGDWCPPAGRPDPDLSAGLISTAFFYLCSDRMAAVAAELGHEEDARRFQEFVSEIRHAFDRAFYRSDETGYGTQTANAFALHLGLVAPKREKIVVAALVRDLRARDEHLSTGHIGTKYIFEVLSDHGYDDLAYQVLSRRDYPSFAFQLDHDATTLWELWARERTENGSRTVGSLSHPFKGGFDAWFFSHILGVRPLSPGFRDVLVAPRTPTGLSWARGSVGTPYGAVLSSWSVSAGEFQLATTVPVNSTALVRLPDGTEHRVGSGEYRFVCGFSAN